MNRSFSQSCLLPSIVTALVVSATVAAQGASTVLELSGSFAGTHAAADQYSALLVDTPPSFDVYGNRVALYSDQLRIIDRTSGAVLEELGVPTDSDYLPYYMSDVWNNFVAFAPGGQSFYVGYGVTGNTDDRIYRVTKEIDGWKWQHAATLRGNFEMVFHNGQAFASANPGGTASAENSIYLVDLGMPGGVASGTHQAIAVLNGYSTGLAFDKDGNLYAATSNLDASYNSTGALYKFSADDVTGAIDGTALTLDDDALKLTDLAYGGNDVEVDAAGHVLASVNQYLYPSMLVQWDGVNVGDGQNYVEVARGTRVHPDYGTPNNFFTCIKTSGDFTADGELLMADAPWGSAAAVVKITPVPEPAALALLLAAAACWLLRRRM